jgi:signal transduction histidine kinase
MRMKCPRCQQDNPTEQKFCGECGTPFGAVGPTGPPAPSYAEVTSALSEALEQQTATSEILKVISSSPSDARPVFDAIVQNAVRLCGAFNGTVFRFDGSLIHVAAHHNFAPEAADVVHRVFPIPADRGSVTGRAILTRSVIHLPDLLSDAEHTRPELREAGFRAILAVPMLRDGVPIGAITVTRRQPEPFSGGEIELLQTFADQAVIAIENVRLFTELQEKNQAVTQAHAQVSEALEQQTATAEILRVISGSQTDIQPVFDTIVKSAARLCDGVFATLFRFDGELLHWMSQHNSTPEGIEAMQRRWPRPPGPETIIGRAVIARTVIHVRDSESDPDAPVETREIARAFGYRSVVSVPMLREGQPVGGLSVARRDQPFTPAQISLLQTFADQAVIAIENVRLFTELEARNREIEDKSRQLEAASQHKSEFLANMSHELRTPLNAVIGFSEVLSEGMFGQLNEKQEEYARDIYSSGQHLLSLINDILDLSKIEAGRMELEVSEFHLPTALDNALTLVRERAGRRGIALGMTVDERLGQIQADERKVRQVVLNLLSNAIKFTPEGGRIEVQAGPVDGMVEIAVSDTGVGIAPEDQEAIFEEFRQVGTAAKKVDGTGLGLALSRKFVELHGGRIWVKSELGAGSTFTFTIPTRIGA